MSDNEKNSPLRQPFLALMASLAAFMAIFGVRMPVTSSVSEPAQTSETANESTKASKAHVEPIVVPIREWDDPFAELEQLLAQSEENLSCSEKSLLDIQRGNQPDAILDILKEKLTFANESLSTDEGKTSPPKLLIAIQIVPGPSQPNAKQVRTLWGHAFRMALSDHRFNRSSEQSIACLQCDIKTKSDSKKILSRKVALPMSLFESKGSQKNSDSESQKHYILNVWLMEEYLGVQPWLCMDTVFQSIAKVLPPGLCNGGCISERVFLAIVGPGSSGTLSSMDPAKDEYSIFGKNAATNDGGECPKALIQLKNKIEWVNAFCTVPMAKLWKENQGKSYVDRIRFIHATPNDDELIGRLADELRTRVTPVFGQDLTQPQGILVFHEDNSEFGRNLIASLQREMTPEFRIKPFPYLRGIGHSISAASNGNSTSNNTNVSDYFRRTIEQYHVRSGQLSPDDGQPFAIGILGGEVRDKISLLQEIRMRYPQALVFTNDLNVQYLDEKSIPFTRNLLVAAHAELSALSDDVHGNKNLISFRDESQTTLWNGYQQLLTRVFRDSKHQGQASSARLFEVGNNKLFEVAVREQIDWQRVREKIGSRHVAPATVLLPSPVVLRAIQGCLGVLLVVAFPLLHAYWSHRSQARRTVVTGVEEKTLFPIAFFF